MKYTSIIRRPAATLAFCAALVFATSGISADTSPLSDADTKFIKQEAAAGMAVVKLAGLGVRKSVHANVKTFAEMLVTDHTKANAELTKLAETKGVELSTVMNPQYAETFQKLEKTESADFDKEFLAEITRAHKKCIGSFEEAASDAKDSDLKVWAGKMIPTLTNHLGQAKELASK